MAAKPFPTIARPVVFHVGNLAAKPVSRQESHEGDSLSVSLHPGEWMQIARIGGQVWRLEKEGALFLDFHKAKRNQKLLKEARSWALQEGYLLPPADTYWTRRWDEEGEESLMPCGSYEEALLEADEEPEDVVVRKEVIVSPKLALRMHATNSLQAFLNDFTLLAWAEDTHPELDGVWWEDTFDVFALSCPRGGIFQSRLENWTRREVSLPEAETECASLWEGDELAEW